jgi:hypothetical protein
MFKERGIATCIILSMVTCGIYGLYWWACLINEPNTALDDPGPSAGVVIILSIITCNIYGIFWAYKQGERLDEIKRKRGLPTNDRGVVYLLLTLFGLSIVAWALMQDELNKLSHN